MNWRTVGYDVLALAGLTALTWGVAVRYGTDLAAIIAGTLVMVLGLIGAARG